MPTRPSDTVRMRMKKLGWWVVKAWDRGGILFSVINHKNKMPRCLTLLPLTILTLTLSLHSHLSLSEGRAGIDWVPSNKTLFFPPPRYISASRFPQIFSLCFYSSAILPDSLFWFRKSLNSTIWKALVPVKGGLKPTTGNRGGQMLKEASRGCPSKYSQADVTTGVKR